MNDYTDIIARLEKADGPNFRLEQEIRWAVKEVPERHRSDNDNPPNYTNSIDAALMLIPGVLHWIASFGQCSEDEPLGGASIWRYAHRYQHVHHLGQLVIDRPGRTSD